MKKIEPYPIKGSVEIEVKVTASVGQHTRRYWISAAQFEQCPGEEIIVYGAGKVAKEAFRKLIYEHLVHEGVDLTDKDNSFRMRATWLGQTITLKTSEELEAEKPLDGHA